MQSSAVNHQIRASPPLCTTPRCPRHSKPAQRGCFERRSSSGDNTNATQSGISEDVLAKLRAAEEEAAALRQQLAAAQASVAQAEAEAVPQGKASRIDGGDLRRETIFSSESAETSWLTEGTMSGYLSKNAPGEGSTKDLTPEEQATVQRRLLLGIGFTVAAAAFALVPTEELRGRPTQPLFFYLVPVLRSRQLLEQALQLEEGDTTGLSQTARAVLGAPNNLKENMVQAAAGLESTRDKTRATELAYDAYEYVLQMDYNKYFESMRGATPTGVQMKAYSDFSRNAAKAALGKLKEFVALFPTEQREAAQNRLDTSPF